MRIELLPAEDAPLLAYELQIGGRREGSFLVESDGSVAYRSPHDAEPWHAGQSASVFRLAAAAWNHYVDWVGHASSDDAQLAVVGELRCTLERIGALDSRSRNLWAILVEQAEQGLL